MVLLGAGALALFGGCRQRAPEPPPVPPLVVLVKSLPDVLDPFQESAGSAEIVFFNVFEPLLRSTPSGTVEPALARSWDASRAGALTLQLAPGARFQDGTPLEAAHVVASLEAARKPGSPFAARLADVAQIRAIGADSLVLETRAGLGLRPETVADIPILKLAPGAALPSGTGPYRVTAFTAGESATLEAVQGRGPKPSVARVRVRRFHGAEDVLKVLEGAEPPLVLSAPPDALALAGSSERYRVVTQPGNDVIMLGFDVAREPTPGIGLSRNPFKSEPVRRAVRLVLDRQALRQGLEGSGLPATLLVPPGSHGFDPAPEAPAARIAEAEALLRNAHLPTGFEVRLDLASEHEALGRVLAGQLEGVGIRVKLNPLKGERLPGVMQSESSLALWSWTPGRDAEWALRALAHTRDVEGGFGASNWTGYSNAEVDRGIEKAVAATDPGARRETLHATLLRLAEDSAWIPLLVPTATFVLPKGLTFPARPDGRIDLAQARLEPQPAPTPPGKRRQGSEKQARLGS